MKDLEKAKSELEIQSRNLSSDMIDSTELLFRLKRTINALEKVSVEDRRPIYSNLIKFAELHPKKIRLGVYAPTLPQAQSAAGDSSNVVGSCRVGNGRGGGT